MKILVTGGAGFIGSHFVRYWLDKHRGDRIVNFDKLTYAGNLGNLKDVRKSPRHVFIRGDIKSVGQVRKALKGVDAVINFAAETHVDRSLLDASDFIQTNVQGTYTIVNAARESGVKRFLHVSTDEVYGSVLRGKTPEGHPLNPSSPYAASKASSDHMVMTQWITYGYPAMVTRCTNNYGPFQYPEKFLPLFITNALEGMPLPLYGRGLNVRNWIHVLDHCEALDLVLRKGRPGEIYNAAGEKEWKNIDVAKFILKRLNRPTSLLNFVKDRPGHDFRYAPDMTKIRRELGWRPRRPFDRGLIELIEWYRANESWWKPIKTQNPAFKKYYAEQYAKRLKN
ncbi:MAG: dTDP-glucose 4,6-dehydratase [Elusimicrobia bacterium]|nr:dTDP-glucose 4,6-dehydratase [Elusimicrobiota bacterium]